MINLGFIIESNKNDKALNKIFDNKYLKLILRKHIIFLLKNNYDLPLIEKNYDEINEEFIKSEL